MRIRVRGYGLLQEALGTKAWKTLEVGDDTTIAELLTLIRVHNDDVMNVLNRGCICDSEYVIRDNDDLELLPFISGG